VHPTFWRLSPPLIVIGMHGSGSSIVSRILMELGVHMGSALDSHYEAGEFFDLNEELLYRAGGAWHTPGPLLQELHRPAFAAAAAGRLIGATYGRLRTHFLSEMDLAGSGAWGWKDPRSSLTLPLWLGLFPHARILHVRREAEGAATSIHRRALREADEGEAGDRSPALFTRAARTLLYPPAALRCLARRSGRTAPFPQVDPCLSLDHCRTLTETYLDACYTHRDLAGPRLEVRYEQLLERPLDVVQTLAAFALGDVPEDRITAAAALVRRSPARAHPAARETAACR
jgi:hypothetical protein